MFTPQEAFWAGEFGTGYIERNRGEELLAVYLGFFARALGSLDPPRSVVELGANIGLNLKALKLLYPGIRTSGVEINPSAVDELRAVADEAYHASIFDWEPVPAELAMIRGVLIHLAPEMLPTAYDKLYRASTKHILISEYYSLQPEALPYRGHSERLYKRDFAGEMLDRFPDLRLVDYGFCYHRDPASLGDEYNWFLMRKG
jgi:pseudaminic acid biosynthesis-associated methylase